MSAAKSIKASTKRVAALSSDIAELDLDEGTFEAIIQPLLTTSIDALAAVVNVAKQLADGDEEGEEEEAEEDGEEEEGEEDEAEEDGEEEEEEEEEGEEDDFAEEEEEEEEEAEEEEEEEEEEAPPPRKPAKKPAAAPAKKPAAPAAKAPAKKPRKPDYAAMPYKDLKALLVDTKASRGPIIDQAMQGVGGTVKAKTLHALALKKKWAPVYEG